MKKNITMICNILSAVLVIVFIVKSIVDYFQYDKMLNSAPFSAQVLVNALYFIIPAIIVFFVGIVVKKEK